MKIGVALSGCSIGGIAAYSVLRELEQQGITIGMISACGIPAATALLYACGCDEASCLERMEQFLAKTREVDMDLAVAELAAGIPRRGKDASGARVPLVVSGVNVSDGTICAFTEGYAIRSKCLRSYPLEDPYDALSAALSPAGDLASYHYEGMELCDFSVWYGVPVYPLKMEGFDKVVSVSFFHQNPRSPYEALVQQKICSSAHLADVQIAVESESADMSREEYIQDSVGAVRKAMDAIYLKTLF